MGALKQNIVKFVFKDYFKNKDSLITQYNIKINEIKNDLHQYSDSNFNDNSWIIKTNKSKDKSVSFKNFEEFGESIIEIIKLFVIIKLNESKTDLTFVKELKHSLTLLSINNIDLYSLNSKIFSLNYINILQESHISQNSKNKTFNSFQQMLYYMNGHKSLGNLDNIEQIKNPFLMNKKNPYKVIDSNTLKLLDHLFLLDETPLHFKVAYWILRLYATRPEETLNYPLKCVTKLNNELAIMRTYIGKETHSLIHDEYGKYHDFHYLNLNNIQMEKLFLMIEQQQQIAEQLQDSIDKKGYLFTYVPIICYGGKLKPQVLSTIALERYLRDIQKKHNISNELRARPRDFKKTGITNRTEFGFNTFELKKMANHKSSHSISSYSSPSTDFINNKQIEIFKLENKIKKSYFFKGKIVNGINEELENKILCNPRAHKLPQIGYCTDISSCGNHFECLGCKDLIPDKELENYYYEQAWVYLEKTKQQEKIGDKINAKDNLFRATLFNELWQRVRD